MSNVLVDVIIVSAGVQNYVRGCIQSLVSQTDPPHKIILIDNSRSRGLAAEFKTIPKVEAYAHPQDLPYAAAVNKGISMSRADYILCINDDVLLDKGFIKESLKGFLISGEIGMVSGKVMRNDRETLDSAGLFLSCFRHAKERGYGRIDKGQFNKEGYIFGVTGAAAFYRRKMLESIKINGDYLDAGYNFFYEDLDLCWRAHNRGWKGYYLPGAIAYHFRGLTARNPSLKHKGGPARGFLNDSLYSGLIINRYLTIIKNENSLTFFIFLPCILAYDIASWVYTLIFRPHLIVSILSNIPFREAFRKRRLIRASAGN